MFKHLNRRQFLFVATGCFAVTGGCRMTQKGRVIDKDDPGRVGSHQAGSEVFRPIVCKATSDLLAKAYLQPVQYQPENATEPFKRRVCFVAFENKTNEELGDFKDQLFEIIDTQVSESESFTTVSPRAVQGVLKNTGFRPDDLFVPSNMEVFSASMQKEGSPFDYMLFAKLTSGTTVDNIDAQKDYMLTLEMVNVGMPEDRLKTSAVVRKEYNRTAKAKISSWF